MMRDWTFGQKLALGFAVTLLLAVMILGVAIYALHIAVSSKDNVIQVFGESLINSERLFTAEAQRVAAIRGYIASADEDFIDQMNKEYENFNSLIRDLRGRLQDPEARRLLEDIENATSDYRSAADKVLGLKKQGRALQEIQDAFKYEMLPKRDSEARAVKALIAYTERARDTAIQESKAAAARSTAMLVSIAILLIVVAIVIATVLTRSLTRQIGAAVQQVQGSSTELQAAANQQVSAATEQATAMNEITTTISELLATSRQIADSAQRVAEIAGQTAGSAQAGDLTMEKVQEAYRGIRQHMDLIVEHMLDLGRKSQQIGTVLEIVAELAEQTNILAINATIEAAGAGESGKRFAVVADEIRKLADRVAGSTKEIRGLIDDVRSSVNKTVMATETGSKTVDMGSKQFQEASAAFKQISSMVSTTTEAAREIELSTKQQTTAVEQVNVAVANVSQAARETESSSGQTLQTASELATLSGNLLQLVRSHNSTARA